MELPKIIKIEVNWTKNRTWGLNPCAELWDGDYTNARVSGCGYDKESAAVSSALNKSPRAQAVALRAVANGFTEMIDPKTGRWQTGGAGMEAVKAVMKAAGYSCFEMHGKTFDGYQFERDK